MKRSVVTGERLPYFWQLERFAPRRRVLRVGLPGHGKSLLTVHDGLRCMAAGMRVWANFELVHPVLGLRAGYVGSWDAFGQVCELPGRDMVVLLQEVQLLCSSREYSRLPLWVHKYWSQSRHYGVEMLMDAQHEDRLDKVMREIVDYVVLCAPTGFRERFGWPIYRETWCSMEQVVKARSAVELMMAGVESNAPVPGESFLRRVRGWEHTAYSTHEIMEPWEYASKEKPSEVAEGSYREPQRWDGSAWVALGEPEAESETVAVELV